MGLQKAIFMPILEPKIAVFKPTIQVIQASLVARGLVSARGRPRGRPGWCGAAAGGAGWLLAKGEAHTPDFPDLLGNRPRRLKY